MLRVGKPRATPLDTVVVIACVIHASYKEFQVKQETGAQVLLKQFTIVLKRKNSKPRFLIIHFCCNGAMYPSHSFGDNFFTAVDDCL